MEIKEEYVDKKGIVYNNIKNISFSSIEDLNNNLGKFFADSNKDSNSFDISDEGVYIYKTLYDENKAYRLYKDFFNYKYISHYDEKITSKLQTYQKNVNLTEFPTGIITLENHVIGQEIPLYKDSISVYDYFKNTKYTVSPNEVYIQILKILKELVKSGIIYRDTHAKNFVINVNNGNVNLIDFEENFISFNTNSNYDYDSMISNLIYSTINKINRITGNNCDNITSVKSLEELEKVLKK